jgi:glycosyltransferase involved in cell wall biosynthesis
MSARFANEIIATNSFHVKRFIKNKIENKRITEVINVADNNIFYEPENKNYHDDELIIAYPSTLAKRLGIDNLIEAMKVLHDKGLKIKLNIYGDGEYRNQILSKIRELGLSKVIALSNSFISLEQLSKELDKAHIGVIPLPSNVSNDIAMPVKIYEFFAKKICVLATDLPLLKDCFNSSVVFFEQGNSEDLAEKLEELFVDRDKLRQFAEKGFLKFSNQTWEYYKHKYQELLNDIR